MPFCRAFLWIFYQSNAFQWSHERQRPVRTLTRIQPPECRMMMLNDTGWMSTANKVGAASILKVPHCLKFVLEFESYSGVQCMAMENHYTKHTTLLQDCFQRHCQLEHRGLASMFLQPISSFCNAYIGGIVLIPWTSNNMRKKYWWVKPSRSTCNKNKPPEITVNARQL